jgi:sugar O-acyltransferase (sialic acid O-acetyltransferase NeuD family)
VAENAAAPSQDRELYVIGAGWFAAEVAGWAEESGFTVRGLVEMMDLARVGGEQSGYPIVDAAELPAGAAAIAAGGRDIDRRAAWAVADRHGFVPATVVHPTAHMSASSTVGAGAIVAPLAVVSAGTRIGEHALLSRGVLVGHDAAIGAFVRLLPGANVAGHVRLGDGVTVGMSAAIVDDVSVEEGAVVAAGAVVLRDVPARTRVQGVPARVFQT